MCRQTKALIAEGEKGIFLFTLTDERAPAAMIDRYMFQPLQIVAFTGIKGQVQSH